MEELQRYEKKNVCTSSLNPLEDVTCWVEGLTSAKYVKELLKLNHSLQGPMTIQERSKAVAQLVQVACKYLEQAAKGPKEVSFLPLYYAFLNLSKAYIAIGPYGHKLSQNRWHGASYDASRELKALDSDIIRLHNGGAIPLFYHTLTEEDMFQNMSAPLTLKMKDVYPYIPNISAEYRMATGRESKTLPFRITIENKAEKQRVAAEYIGIERAEFDKVKINTLQGFSRLYREASGKTRLVSDLGAKGDMVALRAHLRPAMLYSTVDSHGDGIQHVPWARGKLLLPEEFPLICAFFHMSSVVRYNPDGLWKLMDSKYWPALLALRTHGTYRFLLLFWWFVTQCCTFIVQFP